MHAFDDLRTAAYCPRKCYYRQRDDDRDPPPEVERHRDLAFRYPDLLDDADLAGEPIAVTPTQYRSRSENPLIDSPPRQKLSL